MPDSHLLTETFPQPAESSLSLGFKLVSLDMSKMETRVQFDGKKEFTNHQQGAHGSVGGNLANLVVAEVEDVEGPIRLHPKTVGCREAPIERRARRARARAIGRPQGRSRIAEAVPEKKLVFTEPLGLSSHTGRQSRPSGPTT